MPRVSDDDDEELRYHVPGAWAKCLVELRDGPDASVVTSLPDPRLGLLDPPTEYRELMVRAKCEAAEWYARAVEARESVEVSRVVLRGMVAKESPLLKMAPRFTVFPDDLVAPIFGAGSTC